MTTVLKKILRDIRIYKGRTLLTLCGILIGITAVGAVTSSYSILNREMKKNFMDTNPASVVINIADLDDKIIGIIKEKYKNVDVEMRKKIVARISRDDGTFGTIHITAVPDFDSLKVDTFTLEDGRFPSENNEMVLERDSLKILKNLKSSVNENIEVKLPGGMNAGVKLTGKVHAPGLSPASMENYSYGFVKLDMLKNLGYRGWYDELHIVSYENRLDWEQMKALSQQLKDLLTSNGYTVNKIEVPEPGMHPHHDQLASLIFLLQAFAAVALIAACMIIVNLLSFIMSKQRKQIAVMKAVGASRLNIAVPYFIYVLIISTGGLVLSIPLAMVIGRGYSCFAANILNFRITSYSIPFWVYLIQTLVGIAIPLLSSAYPIYKTCKISVKDGLTETVKNSNSKKQMTKEFLRNVNTKIVMPFNNLLRKKSRTIIAVIALTTGGILFMTSLNVIASINKTTEKSSENLAWDYSISLGKKYTGDQIKNAVSQVKGIKSYEIWGGSTGAFIKPDGTDSASYQIRIIPEGSNMMKFLQKIDIESGENKIIINNVVTDEDAWIKNTVPLNLTVNGKTANVTVNSVVNEVPPFPTIYIYQSTYEKLFGTPLSQTVIAAANTRDKNLQREITRNIEKVFKNNGIEISENLNVYALRKAFSDHLTVIVTFLIAISLLAVFVGGICISSAVGINIAERKREFGILRAVGADRRSVIQMVLNEASLMGFAGWLLGVLISYPVSIFIGNFFGQIFLHSDLNNTMSIPGILEWLLVSMGVSLIAGLIPAWKALNSPLRDLLSYE